jgi:NADH dehydrogenase FAD-containing subunit
VATPSLIWCVGVRPDPLVDRLGLPLVNGRIAVDPQLRVADQGGVFACGDAAAVRIRPGQVTAMTAQHAVQQGALAARNVAASLGHGHRSRYRHHDLGFLVDLGGRSAAANPLHLALSGRPAKVVTRAYHLLAMPGTGSTPPWIECSTRPFPGSGCSWAWSARRRSRWIPPPRADPDRVRRPAARSAGCGPGRWV